MSEASRLRFVSKVVVDFTSPSGPRVTQARAGLVIGMVDLLREMGEDARFFAEVPAKLQDLVRYSVASSWVDAQDVELLFAALDRTFTLAAGPAQLGQALGAKIANSLFSALLNAFRPAGSDGILLAVKQADRMWARVYQGGGLVITQTGPKDLRVEVFGLPFAEARSFQIIHGAFLRGMFLTIIKTCVIRKSPVRSGRDDAYALDISWV